MARAIAFLNSDHLFKIVMGEKITFKQQNLICVCKELWELFEELRIIAKWSRGEGRDFQEARGNSGDNGYVHYLACGTGCMGVYVC